MAKRHLAEEIIAKLRQVDIFASQGFSVAGAVRSIAVIDWRDPDIINGS